MTVTIEYVAQMKDAAGTPAETLDLPEGSTVRDAVRTVAKARGGRLAGLLLDGSGNLRPDVLLFLGDEQADWEANAPLGSGSRLTVLSPLAGG